MKRYFVLMVMAVFLLTFSLVVLAENGDDGLWTSGEYWEEYNYSESYDHTEDDGIAWSNEIGTGDEYVNLKEINRSDYQVDVNMPKEGDNDQEVAVSVNVNAYIPCYLELTLTGNNGTTTGQSFGPDAKKSGVAADYQMVFDNEMGGFIDGNWSSLGAGKNAEVEPGDNVYIMACDIFKVDVYSNDDYKYEVQSQALAAQDNKGGFLPVQMGTSLDAGDSWGAEFTFDSQEGTQITNITTAKATESISALHRFRVPYTRSTAHGHYNGTVLFRAVSI